MFIFEVFPREYGTYITGTLFFPSRVFTVFLTPASAITSTRGSLIQNATGNRDPI